LAISFHVLIHLKTKLKSAGFVDMAAYHGPFLVLKETISRSFPGVFNAYRVPQRAFH